MRYIRRTDVLIIWCAQPLAWGISTWTWAWLGVFAAGALIEGVALVNSTTGDTLSEHVWAWLGVRGERAGDRVTPRWTLRVARLALLTFLMWITVHFVTGGWV